MEDVLKVPPTLVEAVRYFADPDTCVRFVAAVRWPNGPVCPQCEGKEHFYLKTRRLWKCKGCEKQFSVKVGTIFEDSAVPLDKWLIAFWMLVNCKNGVSSYEIKRDVKVTQRTAWFMLQRLRLATQSKSFAKLAGDVEVDESFIGGRARNMHAERRARKIQGRRGPEGKAIVAAVLERHGEIRATVVAKRKKRELQTLVRDNVATGANLYSDALKSYEGLDGEYTHQAIDHAEQYVDGQIHTNGCENFWSLLKRGINGTYVSVEPYHLFRYVDEQVYRFNHRKETDAERFMGALSQIAGRRLTWNQLMAAFPGGDRQCENA
jgi:transposase-like protein